MHELGEQLRDLIARQSMLDMQRQNECHQGDELRDALVKPGVPEQRGRDHGSGSPRAVRSFQNRAHC